METAQNEHRHRMKQELRYMEDKVISNIYIRVPEHENRNKCRRVNNQRDNTQEFSRIEDTESSYHSNIQNPENQLKQMHTCTHSNKTIHYKQIDNFKSQQRF